jgi:hypothetical protein
MEAVNLQFVPQYASTGWTPNMRGKAYIALPQNLNLSDVSIIRVKRVSCQ